jgi:phage FluMu protein Com
MIGANTDCNKDDKGKAGFAVTSNSTAHLGWECPRCKTIWSPLVKKCDCRAAASGPLTSSAGGDWVIPAVVKDGVVRVTTDCAVNVGDWPGPTLNELLAVTARYDR